jgi:hypothetical protein
MKVNNFESWLLEREVYTKLIGFLHEGCRMISVDAINEGLISKADHELDRLVKNSKGDLIIAPFIPEVKALVQKFADSGQSGGSAPFTSAVIIDVLKKLMNHEPLGGIQNTDDEWNSLSDYGDAEGYQNNRLSSVFKDGKEGKPYYLNAIVFRNPEKDYTFTSGSVDLPGEANGDHGKVGSSHYIKSFPFEPKTFVIDVDEKEYRKNEDGSLTLEDGGGWWESWVKDPKQLDEVWEYYDRKIQKK